MYVRLWSALTIDHNWQKMADCNASASIDHNWQTAMVRQKLQLLTTTGRLQCLRRGPRLKLRPRLKLPQARASASVTQICVCVYGHNFGWEATLNILKSKLNMVKSKLEAK